MAWLDRIVYRVKAAAPWAYELMAASNAALTIGLYGRRIRRALSDAGRRGLRRCECRSPPARRPVVERFDQQRVWRLYAEEYRRLAR